MILKYCLKLFASLLLCGKQILLLIVISLSFTLIASAQARRPMAPADILHFANVNDAQISPNGEDVLYTVSTVDGDSTRSGLWLAGTTRDRAPAQPTARPAPTSRPEREWPEVRRPSTQLLSTTWNISSPRWSPDSAQIAFLANHEGLDGIWVMSLARSQPRFVAEVQSTTFFITYASEAFAWSPDSKRIAYVSATEEQALSESVRRQADDPRVIDRLQYKSRTGFSDNRRTHIWIVDVEKPEPRQLTFGPFYDHAITFSPNGEEVAFLSNHEPDPDANNNSDIFAVNLQGQVRQITSTKGCEYEPAWSPDGKWIAYTATKRDVTTIDSVAEDTHVWVIASAGGGGRELTGEQDRRARSPRWANNSSILFAAGDRGQSLIYVVTLAGGASHPLFTDYDVSSVAPGGRERTGHRQPFQITTFSVSRNADEKVCFALTDAGHPAEIWIGSTLFESIDRRLSAHNDNFLRSLRLSEPEEIGFRSFDGTPIQGWLMKPVGWRADQRYPLILSVHGGPHGMYGWTFNSTFQVYAASGYAVLYLNPRGSSGYGQKFSDGTLNEWGGGDYKDLMAGVNEALRRYSWIDPNRLGVSGGSYGGFMTNWIITQSPRFKVAVASASVSNLISFYSTSLYQDLVHAEFGGFPWDNYDLLWQWSPMRYVNQVQTPTLFLHGEQDNDVHITQAEEMYMALKRRGVESVLVRYPREGHDLREPRHRVDALERTIAWFDRFLK